MKKIALSLSLFLFFMTTVAQAQECYDVNSCSYANNCCTNFYAKMFGGANFLQTCTSEGVRSSYQTGYIIGGSLGYYWCYGLRLEAEYAFRRNDVRKIHFSGRHFSMHGHFQASSYMANILWDLPLSLWGCGFCNIQPFIGAGIGHDFQQIHSSNSRFVLTEKWNHFSWQVMAGLAYPVFCNTEMTLEYKFHKGGGHFYNHSVGVGLAYKFGLRLKG